MRTRSKAPSQRIPFGAFFVGFGVAVVLLLAGFLAYVYLGRPPVAVADKPALWEHFVSTVALRRRVAADARTAPFPASEDGFEAAARIYRTQCAGCHGNPGHDSAVGRAMLPRAQQFFGRDSRATAARPTGALYWVTNYGVRRSGMPAFAHALCNTDEWNLALLLHSADQDLPDPVKALLAPTIPATAPTNDR